MFKNYIFIAILGMSVAGCAPVLLPFDEEVPAQVLTFAGAPPVHDGRVRFREIFCKLLSENPETPGREVNCEDYLWRLSDEAKPGGPGKPIPAYDTRLRFLIAPGAFAECFPDFGMPYEKAMNRLKQIGYGISVVNISGRSSSSYNAGLIAKAVAKVDLEAFNSLVLIGYSKGATDILHFLVGFPDLAKKVTAVLSIAGAINGTPIADKYAESYVRWFGEISMNQCKPGDEGVMESLERSKQFPWLASHPLPQTVHYFSIATFAHRDKIEPVLLTSYDMLTRIDPRNDSQLIFYDQVIPGATLLGYVNSDHWDVAIAVREELRIINIGESSYPRDILFEAMILFLTETLQESTLIYKSSALALDGGLSQ